MAAPADARNNEDEAPAVTDDSATDLSSSGTIPDAGSLRMLEAFSVELLEPGETNPGLVQQLVTLRERTCLSRARYDVATHCAHRPVVLGWLNDDDGQRPVAAVYLAPTGDWIVRRRDLVQSVERDAVPLKEARFVSLLDVDCEHTAIEHRLAWRLLRDALKAIQERCPPDVRTITYSRSAGLRAFLRQMLRPDQSDTNLFWHVMAQTAKAGDFQSLDNLAATMGNLVHLTEELTSPALTDIGTLREKRGAELDRYLEALTRVYTTELFDTHTGHHLCPVSRFHHYHGGKLVQVVPGSDPESTESLGVVLHFEYNYGRMPARRDRYRQLRRHRRHPTE